MSYYDAPGSAGGNPQWPTAARPPWDARAGMSSQQPQLPAMENRHQGQGLTAGLAPPLKPEDPLAFSSQIDGKEPL